MKNDADDGDCNKNHNNAIKERFQGTAPRKKEYYVFVVFSYWLTMRRLSSILTMLG